MTQRDPGWRLWSTLLEDTQREMQASAWMTAVPQLTPDRPEKAPLLAGATVTLAPRVAQRWVRQLLKQAVPKPYGRAAPRGAANARRIDAIALLEAAISLDEPRLVELAHRGHIEPAVLGSFAYLAALPLLQVCTRSLAHAFPPAWPYGYCPACGSWPTLAELRGVEHTHRLRCARCGGDWGMPLLRCPYCGESDHQNLGVLVPGEGGQTRRVSVCVTCKGYLKVLTTLQGSPGEALVRDDLESIDLDIAALERGYRRPQQPGYACSIRILTPPSRLRTFLGWHAGGNRSDNSHDHASPC
jgi:FdhE protein